MIVPMPEVVLLCAAFFVVGFTLCGLMVVTLRDRLVERTIRNSESEFFAPLTVLAEGDLNWLADLDSRTARHQAEL